MRQLIPPHFSPDQIVLFYLDFQNHRDLKKEKFDHGKEKLSQKRDFAYELFSFRAMLFQQLGTYISYL